MLKGHVSGHMKAAGAAEQFIPNDAGCIPHVFSIIVGYRSARKFGIE